MTALTLDSEVPVYCTSGNTFEGTITKKRDDEITVCIRKDSVESFYMTMRYNYAEARYEADIKGNTINDTKLHLLYIYD